MLTEPDRDCRWIETMKSPQKFTRPYIFINMAMSADGKVASSKRTIKSFGSRTDQEELYRLRSTADAIICGARTLEENHALLDAGPQKWVKLRIAEKRSPQPIRIVVSGTGSVNPESPLFSSPGGPIILITTHQASNDRIDLLKGQVAEIGFSGEESVDWVQTMHWLHKKWGVNQLLCEGGSTLNSTLLKVGMVDRIHLTLCPCLAGGEHAPTIADGEGFETLSSAARFQLVSQRKRGDEYYLQFEKL